MTRNVPLSFAVGALCFALFAFVILPIIANFAGATIGPIELLLAALVSAAIGITYLIRSQRRRTP